MSLKHTLLFLLTVILLACNEPASNSTEGDSENTSTPNINFTVIKSYPHDTSSFTEGLLIHKGELYESTGASLDIPKTRSLFGIMDLKTGKIATKAELDRFTYFGEGIAILNDKVFQLTYKTKLGFVYDLKSFKKIKEFTFTNAEGWGLTTDGTNLIMSDGTFELTYLNPINLQPIKKLTVKENGYAKEYLNELEYIKGYIFANIWMTNTIVKIDPKDGKIVAKLDLSSLASEAKRIYPGSMEMNGIAYDAVSNMVFVTGKLWPKMYELQIGEY